MTITKEEEVSFIKRKKITRIRINLENCYES